MAFQGKSLLVPTSISGLVGYSISSKKVIVVKSSWSRAVSVSCHSSSLKRYPAGLLWRVLRCRDTVSPYFSSSNVELMGGNRPKAQKQKRCSMIYYSIENR